MLQVSSLSMKCSVFVKGPEGINLFQEFKSGFWNSHGPCGQGSGSYLPHQGEGSHCGNSVFFHVCLRDENSLLNGKQVFNSCLSITYKVLHDLTLVCTFLYSHRSIHTSLCFSSDGSTCFWPQALCTCSSPRYFYTSLPHFLPVFAQPTFIRETFTDLYWTVSADNFYLLSFIFSLKYNHGAFWMYFSVPHWKCALRYRSH